MISLVLLLVALPGDAILYRLGGTDDEPILRPGIITRCWPADAEYGGDCVNAQVLLDEQDQLPAGPVHARYFANGGVLFAREIVRGDDVGQWRPRWKQGELSVGELGDGLDEDELERLFSFHPSTDRTWAKHQAILAAEDVARTAVGAQESFSDINTACLSFAQVLLREVPAGSGRRAAVHSIQLAWNAANEAMAVPSEAKRLVAISRTKLQEARWMACSAVTNEPESVPGSLEAVDAPRGPNDRRAGKVGDLLVG